MAQIVAAAVEAYRRQQMLAAINAGYTTLRADPAAWATYQDELHGWEATLADGLAAADAPEGT